MSEPVLCYVDGPWAYFTTQPLDKQWGDDWNDAPYDCNAGAPYEWREGDGDRYEIVRVAWRGPFETPNERIEWRQRESWLSVDQINAGASPWLIPYDGHAPAAAPIAAGITLGEFVQRVADAGGDVYTSATAKAAP